jgi:hypothetical protein
MMVAFEDPQLGNAGDELEGFGHEFACEVLIYLQKVYSQAVDFRNLFPFATSQGIEMFQALMGTKFAIFAVEVDDMGDLKITLMLAGQHGVPMQAGAFSWDGNSYEALKTGILNARAAVWFV